MGNDHADRSGPRRWLGEDRHWLVADRHRDVITATCAYATHAHDNGQLTFFHELAQMVINIIAAGNRAARRANSNHDADHFRVVADTLDLLHRKTIFALHDRAAHVDDRDLFSGKASQRMVLLLRHIRGTEVTVI